MPKSEQVKEGFSKKLKHELTRAKELLSEAYDPGDEYHYGELVKILQDLKEEFDKIYIKVTQR